MKNVPLLRQLDQSRVVSRTKILSAGKFAHMMIDLGYRAGYTGRFSPYAIRRGHGNTIDRQSDRMIFVVPSWRVSGVMSAVQRRRQMGHKSDDVFMHYISAVSGVDIQNVINGRDPDQALIDYVRSMQARVDHDAPLRDGSRLTDVVRRDSDALDYAVQRGDYFAREDNIFEGSDSAQPFTMPACERSRSKFFQSYLRYNKARANMINSIQRTTNAAREQPLVEVLRSLAVLACPDGDWAYPSAKPSGSYACFRCGWQGTRKYVSLSMSTLQRLTSPGWKQQSSTCTSW
jgi:hypothetical protein